MCDYFIENENLLHIFFLSIHRPRTKRDLEKAINDFLEHPDQSKKIIAERNDVSYRSLCRKIREDERTLAYKQKR